MDHSTSKTSGINLSDTALNLFLGVATLSGVKAEDLSKTSESEIESSDSEGEQSQVVEEIVLGNEFDETASVIIPATIDFTYTQQNKFRGITRFFKIYNDIYLHKSIQSFRNKKIVETRINLTYINSEPVREKFFAKRWFYTALLSGAFAAFFLWIGVSFSSDMMRPYLISLSVIGLTTSVLASLIFYYRSQDKIFFRSNYSEVPLIELFYKPKQPEYLEFVEALKTHIENAQTRQGLSYQQRLKGELTDLRRLNEEGVIETAEYEHARSLILKHDY